MPLVWVNGSLTDASAAAISVFDHGLVAGDGLFETVEIHEGRPFALTRHLRRMRRSAATLGFDPGISDDTLRQATDETIAANPESGLLRLTITPGRCPLGSTRDDGPSTVILATAPSRDWGESIDVSVVDWVRNERGALAGVKSTSYAENVMALARAHEAGASEALFANTLGNLCEGTGSNVFVELDGRLVTPPLSSGCLAGVTRELLLEILDIGEVDVPIEHLGHTEEAFITSSTRDVLAVAHVDGEQLPLTNGPLTKEAAESFASLKASNVDP